MGSIVPWLIVGWIFLRGGRRAPAPAAAAPAKPAEPPYRKATPSVAYIYRLPGDGYETTRMALAQPPEGRPQEMGIFSSPAAALDLVREEGWVLAWPEVRELTEAPK